MSKGVRAKDLRGTIPRLKSTVSKLEEISSSTS